MPQEAVLRNSRSLVWHLGKHQDDDFNLIWPAGGSRQFGEEWESPNWEVCCCCLSARQEGAKAWLAVELLAAFELKGSCQTKPQAAQPHSLEIMGEGGGGPGEKSSLCFERKKLFVLSNNATEKKKKKKMRSHYVRDCELDGFRVSNFKRKRKSWTHKSWSRTWHQVFR